MITNFVLYEGRGISDIIKVYTNYIYEQFHNKEYQFEIDLDDYQELPLTSLKISFDFSNKQHGKYIPGELKYTGNKYYLDNVILLFKIDDASEDIVKGLISHELTHIKEYYEIKKRIHETQIEITPIYIKIRNAYTDLKITEDHPYYEFIYLLYLTLSTEMNSRIAQVYDYLYSLKIKDETELLNKLTSHKNWKFLELLNRFNNEKFVEEMIDKIELSGLINITNDLISKLKFQFDKDYDTKSQKQFNLTESYNGEYRDLTKNEPDGYRFDPEIINRIKDRYGLEGDAKTDLIPMRYMTTVIPTFNTKVNEQPYPFQTDYYVYIPEQCYDYHANPLKIHSVISDLVDPQADFNKSKSLILELLGRYANKGWVMDENAIDGLEGDWKTDRIAPYRRVRAGYMGMIKPEEGQTISPDLLRMPLELQ